jgi:hypothetical protein
MNSILQGGVQPPRPLPPRPLPPVRPPVQPPVIVPAPAPAPVCQNPMGSYEVFRVLDRNENKREDAESGLAAIENSLALSGYCLGDATDVYLTILRRKGNGFTPDILSYFNLINQKSSQMNVDLIRMDQIVQDFIKEENKEEDGLTNVEIVFERVLNGQIELNRGIEAFSRILAYFGNGYSPEARTLFGRLAERRMGVNRLFDQYVRMVRAENKREDGEENFFFVLENLHLTRVSIEQACTNFIQVLSDVGNGHTPQARDDYRRFFLR